MREMPHAPVDATRVTTCGLMRCQAPPGAVAVGHEWHPTRPAKLIERDLAAPGIITAGPAPGRLAKPK
jgi:hypothetical protein